MRIVESNKNENGVCTMHKEEIGAADERYILSSVDSALSILNLFYEHEELGASEVGKLMGMSRSTAFRFMVTLERRGYVTKTTGGKYRLGLNLFSLGMVAYNRMELVSLVHPYLVQMAEESGETCHVAILSDGVHVMFIDRALGTSSLKMDTALGYSQTAHCTATGKAILAFQPDHVLNQYLRSAHFPQITKNAIPDAGTLLRRLDQVRLDGYASDDEEAEVGLTCYAMPLLDVAGRAYAAVSTSGPTTRMVRHKEEHLERITATVKAISKTIV